MGLIGIAWVLIIVLKLASIAFVTTSWLIVIFWPIVPLLVIFLLFMLGATGVIGWKVFKGR